MSPSDQRRTIDDVMAMLDVDEPFLVALEREAIVSRDPEGRYDAMAVERIRLCRTLATELGVNLEGIEVALHLMDVIRDERREFGEVLAWLRSQMAER